MESKPHVSSTRGLHHSRTAHGVQTSFPRRLRNPNEIFSLTHTTMSDDNASARPPNLLAELQKRTSLSPRPVSRSPAPPPSSSSSSDSLQDKLAKRRQQLDEAEKSSSPAPRPAPSSPSSAEPAAKKNASLPAAAVKPPAIQKSSAAKPSAVIAAVRPSAVIVGVQSTERKVAVVKKPVVPAMSAAQKAAEAEDWITHQTADGEAYYVNKRTGKSTWDKPAVLLAEGESDELDGEWLWVQHEELAWIPAKVVKRLADGSLEVTEQHEGSSNDTRRVLVKEIGPMIHSAKHLTSLTSDLVQLDDVHEPGIIDLLRRRYVRDKIYTNVGDILIAVNPFKATPLFTPQIMHEYADRTKTAMELPPHPYAVINASLQDLIEFQKDQSLLISGESGAGKTVTVKVCLEFVSEVAGSTDNVEEQILASNPLLEAFGNAKTKRNDNSSRFGKFMEVHLSKESGYKIVGCSVVHYLLEKSRVVAQAEGERNFHAFYYVVAQTPQQERDDLLLGDRNPESFKYLSKDGSSCADPENHDDGAEYTAMRNSFNDMGVAEQAQMDCFKVVAAVLHMGDIEFEEFQSTGSKIKNRQACEAAATLLSVPADLLEKVLTKHESMQRDGMMTRAFNPSTAADARNALARHAYGRLFDYLIRMVNKAMAADRIRAGKIDTRYIGMLDIFGFEIFDVNSFEQLSINFANEKLQQLFNKHTFTLEERTYQEEGIHFDHISFHDSQPLLSFLGLGESRDTIVRDGVYQILDEQTAVGSGTDDKFLQNLRQKHRDKKSLFSDLCKLKTRFKVFHYAGQVEYETTGFVAKNADKLYENILELMRGSESPFISEQLFGADLVGGDDGTAALGGQKAKTQASLFMRQLQALEARTNTTFPRYVRCIKPNSYKKPKLFDSTLSLQQLRFAGVFEAVSIRKMGFPFRHTHQHFFEYFRCLVPHDHAKWKTAKKIVADGQSVKTAFTALAKRLWEDIVEGPVPEASDCRFGKTMVLFRAKEHRQLEIARLAVLNRAAATIQKVAKGRYVRRHTPEIIAARTLLQAAIKSRNEELLDKEISAASVLFFKTKAAFDAEAVRASVRQEKKMKPRLEKLLLQDYDSDNSFQSFDSAVSEMDSFIAKDALAFQKMDEARKVREIHGLCKERRQIKQDLHAVVNEVASSRIAKTIAELAAALKKADDLGKRGEKTGGVTFFRKEMDNAKENLSHLKTESTICARAVKSSSLCHLLGEPAHTQPGDLDSSYTRAGTDQMRIDVEALRNHEPRSADTIEALIAMETILDLRESAILALDLGEGAPADEPEWGRVEAVLRDVRGLQLQFDLFTLDSNEVLLISNDLALRAAVDDVVTKLNEAIQAVDDEQLQVALDQAHVLNMFEHPDTSIQNVCRDSDDLLPKVQHARASLAEALREVQEELLRDALCAQSAIGFGIEPGMMGHESVLRARQMYAWVVELTAEARLAYQVMYSDPSKMIVQACDEIRLRLPDLLDPLREMLGLPTDKRLLRQRDAAVACGNYRRAVRLQVEAKDVLFDKGDSRANFGIGNFPGLKTPEDFSRRFGIHWKKYKEGMLTWYNPLFGKIHTPLTVIEGPNEEDTKNWNRKAPYLFRNVFAVMGDKKVVEVDGLAHEILSECLTIPALRDEVYCQLMKQLTQNPHPESESRGWNLMALCLTTFPPSSQLENYLESFLRISSRSECVWKLHQTLLGGPLMEPPSLEIVTHLRVQASIGNTSFWMPGRRTQISFEEFMFTNAEKVEQVKQDWRAVRYTPNMEFADKRRSKQRNSGGFEVHLGGQAPKLAPQQGLTRAPSIMLNSGLLNQLMNDDDAVSSRSSVRKSNAPVAATTTSRKSVSGPPPSRSASTGGPPPRLSVSNAPPSRPSPSRPSQPQQAAADDFDDVVDVEVKTTAPPPRKPSVAGVPPPRRTSGEEELPRRPPAAAAAPPPRKPLAGDAPRKSSAVAGDAPPPPRKPLAVALDAPPPSRKPSAAGGDAPPPRKSSALAGDAPPAPRTPFAAGGDKPPPRKTSAVAGDAPARPSPAGEPPRKPLATGAPPPRPSPTAAGGPPSRPNISPSDASSARRPLTAPAVKREHSSSGSL